ncbi:unnamed protein product [Discosporangium mesarthrocarpum]
MKLLNRFLYFCPHSPQPKGHQRNRQHVLSIPSMQTTDIAKGENIYISGFSLGGELDSSVAFLMACNSSGMEQWVVEYGSTGEDLGNAVAVDDTGVYMVGSTTVVVETDDATSVGGAGGGATAADDKNAFIVKYNSTGDLQWERSWGTPSLDMANGVAVDSSGGLVYVVGLTRGSMGPEQGAKAEVVNAGSSDVFLSCVGADRGELRWTAQLGSSATDVGNRVAVGPRGGVFVVGQLGDDEDPGLSGAHAFLAKYDYLGNLQFTSRLNSSTIHYVVDLAPAVGTGGEGVVYMSGNTLGDSTRAFLARVEGQTGNQTWLQYLGDGDSPHHVSAVAVVEGRGAGYTDGGKGSFPGSEWATGDGEEAMVIVVGYNTSEDKLSGEGHASSGFVAASKSWGEWAWSTIAWDSKTITAVDVGFWAGEGARVDSGEDDNLDGAEGHDGEGGVRDNLAVFILGNVAADEEAPGENLFLEVQEVIWAAEPEEVPAPNPMWSAPLSTPEPSGTPDALGGVSSTTGLSQTTSLWLIIIAPVVVVVGIIVMLQKVASRLGLAQGHGGDEDRGGPGGGGMPHGGGKVFNPGSKGFSPMTGSVHKPAGHSRRTAGSRGSEDDWQSMVDRMREKVTAPKYQELSEDSGSGIDGQDPPGELEMTGCRGVIQQSPGGGSGAGDVGQEPDDWPPTVGNGGMGLDRGDGLEPAPVWDAFGRGTGVGSSSGDVGV